METEPTRQSMTPLLLKICLVLSAILIWALVALPTTRQHLRRTFSFAPRTVLSSVAGDILKKGQQHRVFKVKTPEGLFLEVFENTNKSISVYKDTIQLPSDRDAYFHLHGQATNLALKDIDGDQYLEILAPTFDKNMKVRLNVVTLNPETEKLEFFQRKAPAENPKPIMEKKNTADSHQ